MKSLFLEPNYEVEYPTDEELRNLRKKFDTLIVHWDGFDSDYNRFKKAGFVVGCWITFNDKLHIPKADFYALDIEPTVHWVNYEQIKDLTYRLRLQNKPVIFVVQMGYFFYPGYFAINRLFGSDYKKWAKLCDGFMPMIYDTPFIEYFWKTPVERLKSLGKPVYPIFKSLKDVDNVSVYCWGKAKI